MGGCGDDLGAAFTRDDSCSPEAASSPEWRSKRSKESETSEVIAFAWETGTDLCELYEDSLLPSHPIIICDRLSLAKTTAVPPGTTTTPAPVDCRFNGRIVKNMRVKDGLMEDKWTLPFPQGALQCWGLGAGGWRWAGRRSAWWRAGWRKCAGLRTWSRGIIRRNLAGVR